MSLKCSDNGGLNVLTKTIGMTAQKLRKDTQR